MWWSSVDCTWTAYSVDAARTRSRCVDAEGSITTRSLTAPATPSCGSSAIAVRVGVPVGTPCARGSRSNRAEARAIECALKPPSQVRAYRSCCCHGHAVVSCTRANARRKGTQARKGGGPLNAKRQGRRDRLSCAREIKSSSHAHSAVHSNRARACAGTHTCNQTRSGCGGEGGPQNLT